VCVNRRERLEIGVTLALVAAAAVCHFALGDVTTFVVTAVALAALARLVGHATEQLGSRLGSGAAGVVQSALGNLPELFIALFALNKGLVTVVQAALVGSILANSILVLGIAFLAGGLKNGVQRFNSNRARMISTLLVLAAATMALPSLAEKFHTPAAAHSEALSLICAGVLLIVFVVTIPTFLQATGDEEHVTARWSPLTTAIVLGGAGVLAALTSDWFVTALTPAIHTLHMSQEFAGLVIVAIAGNAVENVVGVTLAAKGRADLAVSVIKNSVAQVAVFLFPVLVLISLLFSNHLTFVVNPVLTGALALAAIAVWAITGDGRAVAFEGWALVGFYVILSALVWYE
jgi:Ca2+:H+ antiporter